MSFMGAVMSIYCSFALFFSDYILFFLSHSLYPKCTFTYAFTSSRTRLSPFFLFSKIKYYREKVTRLKQSKSLFQLTGVFFKNVDGREGEYTGEGVGGVPHGRGVITFKDGSVYKGDMKNGTIHGQGTWTFAFASYGRYVGAFENGAFHGQGTWTKAYGECYVGAFENGEIHGQGSWTKAWNVNSDRYATYDGARL